MRLSVLAAFIATFAAPLVVGADSEPEPLVIEVTHKVECDKPTQKGDKIEVHYSGTLENGTISVIPCPAT
jgi:hypothetical protein